ncbi:MAG TPA: hypothetical protein VEQ15_01365 [Myxococcales bacterium]|nr:hypothetical protein [Myxococcales bacterium]
MRAARLVALALACAAVVAFLLLRRSGTEAGRDPAATSERHPGTPAARPAAPPAPLAPPPAAIAPAGLDPVMLASPQTTVETELRLLEGGKADLFRQTFLPSVQPQVTAEAFEACRKRVRQVPVRPDWETAEASTSGGHRVVRVSMFGKSMTGFHQVDRRWLADAVWCLPVGLP